MNRADSNEYTSINTINQEKISNLLNYIKKGHQLSNLYLMYRKN